MAYGGENTITITGWSGTAGSNDEPNEAKLNRVLVQRFQISASEQMEPADTGIEVANTQRLTIPANTLKAGDRLRIKGFSKVTGQNGTDTIRVRLRIGGLTGVMLATVTPYDAATNDRIRFTADVWFESVGTATNSKFHSHGLAKRTGGSDEDTYVEDNTTLDTTAAIDVVYTQFWSADNSNNRCKLYELSAELFRTRQAWA